MSLNVGFLLITVLKIAGLLAWMYGLLWGLGQRTWAAKLVTVFGAFAVIQLAISLPFGPVTLFSDFDSGLLFQACTMAMVALGLNLIYGFNGQFSLGQWGFYGIGAYAAADITYRWTNDDASGLLVVGIGVILIGLGILGVQRFLNRYTGVPVMSAFTLYLFGSIAAGAVAVMLGGAGHAALAPDVPLHFSAFHPDWKMTDHRPTPPATLTRARELAMRNGLRYVYTGNVHDRTGGSTWCHGCGALLIERDWYELGRWGLTPDGGCAACGERIPGVFAAQPGTWGAQRMPVRLHRH